MQDLSLLRNFDKSRQSNKNAAISCEIVRFVFQNIRMCIESDRSFKKLNMIEKGIIKGMINENTLRGIDNYVLNMYPSDIKELSLGIKKLADKFEIDR